MSPDSQWDQVREVLGIDPKLAGQVWLYAAGAQFTPRRSHAHDELEFNLCVSGEAEYLMDGGRITLKPGHILWLFPEQIHALHRATADFQMWIAVFRPGLIDAACRQPENLPLRDRARPNRPTKALLPPKEALGLTNALLAASAARLHDQSDRFNALLPPLLLDAWAQTQAASQRPPEDALHPAVYRAAMRLHQDPTTESLAALARDAGLSFEHLSRLFARQMGQTMRAYRTEQRLRLFREHLAGQRFNLTEAALEAGFGSYAQCYRACMEQIGVKPSQLKAGSN